MRRGLLLTGDPEALGSLQSQSKSLRPPATPEATIRLLTAHLPFPVTLGAGCCPTSPGSQTKQAQRRSAVARAEAGLDSRPQPPGHQGGTASCGVSWGSVGLEAGGAGPWREQRKEHHRPAPPRPHNPWSGRVSGRKGRPARPWLATPVIPQVRLCTAGGGLRTGRHVVSSV